MTTEPLARGAGQRSYTSARVERSTYDRLAEMAREQQVPIARLIARAVDTYDRVSMAEESNAAYARLKQDPEAWADWQTELGLWEATLLDGLEIHE